MTKYNFFFFWHFYCLMFSELSESLVCCLTLIWEIHSHCCFKYFFCPFLFSPSAVPIMWLLYHLQLSSSSWIFSSAFSVFFLFAFQFEEFLLKYPQLHKFFLQPCPSIISPSKTFLMLQYFFISIISFFFSFRISSCLLIFPVCSCLLFSLFISVLNILIIVILNFQSDHLIISVSLLYLSLVLMLACSLSSNYGFLLLAFWVYLLFIYFGYLGMLYWVKELQK